MNVFIYVIVKKFTNFFLETNLRSNNFIQQEFILKSILDELNLSECKEEDTNLPTKIQKDLTELRNSLLNDKQIRFHLVSDLNKLSEHMAKNGASKLDKIWLDHFPASLKYNDKLVCITNQPFSVPLTWNFQKQANKNHLKKVHQHRRASPVNSPNGDLDATRIFSPTPNQDFLINLGATESSYVRLLASTDIDSYTHPNYAGVLVLIEYFTQAEGPLWEAVRGPGYCYHQTSKKIQLSLRDRCLLN
jgi:Zn-dependent M16 (insulinase) family peptidase